MYKTDRKRPFPDQSIIRLWRATKKE